MFIIFQCPCFKVHAIASSSATSPTRFVIAVISPAARDFEF